MKLEVRIYEVRSRNLEVLKLEVRSLSRSSILCKGLGLGRVKIGPVKIANFQ